MGMFDRLRPPFGTGSVLHFSRIEVAVVRASLTLRCMARKLRLEYAGAICHVMNRGDQREVIRNFWI
jgi:hypothetical protein